MGQPRHLIVPNANSPELLTRLLDMVGRGVRSTRSLSEALGVEPRTVEYYSQAGEWLGFLEVGEECQLTPLGMEYVYAGKDQALVYARAVWANPLVAELLVASDDKLPSIRVVSEMISARDPNMAPTTVRRRASSLRGLIAPAIGVPRVRRRQDAHQLALPFGARLPPPPKRRLKSVGATEFNPDAYHYLLGGLYDYGELRLNQIRGLLDRAGAAHAPIGGYIRMVVERGDAERVSESLVATAAGSRRLDLLDSTSSILLSDPAYRSYLSDCLRSSSDLAAARRWRQQQSRYRSWDDRIVGHPVEPDTLLRELEEVLLERSLESFPVAVPEDERVPKTGPFLEVWAQPELRIALPPSLAGLQGGVAAINRELRAVRQSPDATRAPSLASPVRWVHGGALHPGEAPPRAVPDTRSLRLRLITNSPYVTLTVALLLIHRGQPENLRVHRSRGRWRVRWKKRNIGALLQVMDRFAARRGYTVLRRPKGGLPDAALLDMLESVGIASTLGKQAVLSERFFGQLREAPEESEVFALLRPLVQTFEDDLGAL